MGHEHLDHLSGSNLAGVVLLAVYFSYSPIVAVISIALFIIYKYFKNTPADKQTITAFLSGFRVGGHRGSPKVFPENSLSGFVQAKKEGADLIEFDVALTKDGFAVILHDDELDRTTNMTGPIREKNLSELTQANVAAKFVRSSNGHADPVISEGIPSLESIVSWGAKNNMKMLFDVKDHDPSLVETIVELFQKYELHNNSIVCSFFPWVVYRVKRADRRIPTGLTWRTKFFAYHDQEHTRPRYSGIIHYIALAADFIHESGIKGFLPGFLGADILLTNSLEISSSFVNAQREKGIQVVAWTVNDISEMQWMLETLKIPILTDVPYHINTLNGLRQIAVDA